MLLERGSLLVDRYRIESVLGKGGFGAVYLANDERLGIRCAVKQNLNTSPTSERQFSREASLLATLRHPHLPRVTHHFISGDHQYLVMDFVEGEDLQARLVREGPLDETEVLRWADQIADAVIYLHSLEPPVIHRDIKPANIRLTPDGDAMLVDFGLAKESIEGQKTTTSAMGVTPGFAPPEQYGLGHTDHLTDIYALGATFYTLLAGTAPPESVERLLGAEKLTPLNQHRPDIPRHVADVLTQALQIRRARRFQSVAEFLKALKDPDFTPTPTPPKEVAEDLEVIAFTSEEEIEAAREESIPTPEAVRSPRRRGFQLNRFAVIGTLVFIGIFIILLLRASDISQLVRSLVVRSTLDLEGLAFNPRVFFSTPEETLTATLRVSVTSTFVAPTPTPTPTPIPVPINLENAGSWRLYNSWSGADMSIPIALSPDGKTAALRSARSGVDIHDLLTGELKQDLTDIVIGGENRIIGTTLLEDHLLVQLDEEIRRYGLKGENIERILAITGTDMLVSQDAGLLGVRDRYISIYDLQSDELLNTTGAEYSQQDFVFSPDGRFFALAQGNNVKLFDLESNWEERTLLGHGEPTEHLEFTSDSARLVSASGDVWDIASGDRISLFDSSTDLIAISADDQLIAGGDGSIWDLNSGETVGAIPVLEDRVGRLQFTPDGFFLCRQIRNGPVQIWVVDPQAASPQSDLTADEFDVDSLKPITNLNVSRLEVSGEIAWTRKDGFALSPDGTITAGWRSRTLSIADLNTGEVVAEIQSSGFIREAAFLDSDFLLVLTNRGEVERWEISTLRKKQTYSVPGNSIAASHEAGLFAVQDKYIQVVSITSGEALYRLGSKEAQQDFEFTPDGKFLVIAAGSGVGLWDMESGLPAGQLGGHGPSVHGLSFAQNGRRLVSSSGDVWEIESRELIAAFDTQATALTVSPDGQLVIGADGTLWDGNTGQYIGTLDEKAAQLEIASDGRRLVWNTNFGDTLLYQISPLTAHSFTSTTEKLPFNLTQITTEEATRLHLIGWWGSDELLRIRYIRDQLQPSAYSFADSEYRALARSPDGMSVAAFDGLNIDVLNPATGQVDERYQLFLNSTDIKELAFLGDSLLVLKNLAGVERWDLEEQTLVQRYNISGHDIVSSEDGSHFALQSDGRVHVVDATSGEVLYRIRTAGGSQAHHFSPDGKLLAVVGNVTAELWNMDSGEREHILRGHTADVRGLIFTEDGSKLISASGDVWEVENGTRIVDFGSTALIGAVTPDGNIFVGEDGAIWNLQSGARLGTLTDLRAPADQMFFTSDGKVLVWRTMNHRIYQWGALEIPFSPILSTPSHPIKIADVPQLKAIGHVGRGRLQNAVWSMDDQFVAVNTSHNTIVYLASSLARQFARLGSKTLVFNSVNHVLLGGALPLQLQDISSGETIWKREMPGINAAAYSPDDELLALGGTVAADGPPDGLAILNLTDNTIQILDEGLGRYAAVTAIQFTSDSNYLVASYPNAISIWDMQTKSQIREPISGNIRPASLSPDSEFIAYLSERTIIVERLSSGWKHFEINADGTPFFPSGLNHPRLEPIDLVFQENGSLLVFTREFDRRTFETNLVLIDWDIDQGSAVSRGNELLDLTDLSGVFSEDYMNERPQNVPAFTLSPLESRFISLTRDGKARTWDMEAKSLLAESSADYLDLMALSPNGKSVAVPDALGGIDILDLHTAVVIRRLEGDWYPTRIVYNSDSILLVLDAGNRLSFIDATNGRILESYVNDEIDNTATFTQSTHGRLHAAVRLTGGSKLLRVFSLSHQKPLLDFGRFPIPFQAQFSPDGQMLAGISRNRVLLWDLQTQLILGELEGAGRSIGPLVFTPNGNVLISSSGEIWEIEDRNLKAIFENSNPSSNLRTNGSVVLSQDGEFWDIETGLYLGKLLGIDSPARNFEFTPDGGQIIWQPEGGVIEIWEVVQ